MSIENGIAGFCPETAVEYGLESAVMIGLLKMLRDEGFMEVSEDGFFRSPAENMADIFGFLTRKKSQRILNGLVNQGLATVDRRLDETTGGYPNWYRVQGV